MLKITEIKRLTRKAMLLLPFCVAALALSLSSCSESDDTVVEYPDWQNRNVTYWDSLYTATQAKVNSGDTTWKIIKNFSVEDSLASPNTDYIIVNVQTTGKGSGCPLYTDSVRVRYTGQLLPSTSYPNGYIFDTTNKSNAADSISGVADFKVSGLTSGFATALQHMHIGDVWMVYVPWTLGYGTDGSSSIPGYSVLRFRIQLIAYARAGSKLPNWK
ncbi:MAG: FKBP-type peptidyl-prolyl cis-trans isomerase [Prevotella sp.]